MSFASPIPLWALAAAVAAFTAAAFAAYRHDWLALSRRRAATLVALRTLSLVTLLLLLLRPVMLEPLPPGGTAVAVLVDASRSMGIDDTGESRLARARALVGERIQPALATAFDVSVFTFGGSVSDHPLAETAAIERRSDLRGAIADVRSRYRDRRLAGTVVLSDGADTGGLTASAAGGAPVFAVPIGAPEPALDREVVSLSVDEEAQLQSLIDLSIIVAARGTRDPFTLRVLENGRAVHSRRVEPSSAAGPIRFVVPVAPPRDAPAVYSVEVDEHPEERVRTNNRRAVLVRPAERRRTVLLVEGAPGFEHSFLKRALSGDPALEVDAVVRKGQNEEGEQTFYVQATADRAPALASGLPVRVEDLFRYDALVLANVEADTLSTAQLALVEAFVAKRGGGLLVLGARSFDRNGLRDTPIEAALPVSLTDRGDDAGAGGGRADANRLTLTADGLLHPIMRVAAGGEASREQWLAAPSLASTAGLGGPRPGAVVLATAGSSGGLGRPLVAVQRYGEGRSMIFGGEAAWRWRMMMPATDGTYDSFWRQSMRWLAGASPRAIEVHGPVDAMPGEPVRVNIRVRNAAFAPAPGAVVSVAVEGPAGERESPVPAAADDPALRTAVFTPAQDGVYRVTARVRWPDGRAESASTSVLIGGTDAEMAEPWRHDAALARIAEESGGALVAEADLDTLPALLEKAAGAPELREKELWHHPLVFMMLIALLGAEWSLRRRWGLR
ncbi:MAG TPA: glutamine amidotransferase [Vicinamibacterales bacterium]|nr:glutamine amidotransferase [Vicinamibacterales bacterium]